MSSLTRAGAILTIVACSFVLVFSFFIFIGIGINTTINPVYHNYAKAAIISIAIISFIYAIITLIFTYMLMHGDLNKKILVGILSLVAITLGTFLMVFPAILFLLGGIFILVGKDSKDKLHNKE